VGIQNRRNNRKERKSVDQISNDLRSWLVIIADGRNLLLNEHILQVRDKPVIDIVVLVVLLLMSVRANDMRHKSFLHLSNLWVTKSDRLSYSNFYSDFDSALAFISKCGWKKGLDS